MPSVSAIGFESPKSRARLIAATTLFMPRRRIATIAPASQGRSSAAQLLGRRQAGNFRLEPCEATTIDDPHAARAY